jgi:hypothetical protein
LSIMHCMDDAHLLTAANYRSLAQFILSQQTTRGGFRGHPVLDNSKEVRNFCRLESTAFALHALAMCDFASGDNNLASAKLRNIGSFLVSAFEQSFRCPSCREAGCIYANNVGDAFFLLSAIQVLASGSVRIDFSSNRLSTLRNRAEKVIPISRLAKLIPGAKTDGLLSCLSHIEDVLHEDSRKRQSVDHLAATALPTYKEDIRKIVYAFAINDLLSVNNHQRACLYLWLGWSSSSSRPAIERITRSAPWTFQIFVPYIWRWLPSVQWQSTRYLVVYDQETMISVNVANLAVQPITKVRPVDVGARKYRLRMRFP